MIHVDYQRTVVNDRLIKLDFIFDDGVVIKKTARVSDCADACGVNKETELAYQTVKKYRESIRDWLHIHNGKFTKRERLFENILFKLK